MAWPSTIVPRYHPSLPFTIGSMAWTVHTAPVLPWFSEELGTEHYILKSTESKSDVMSTALHCQLVTSGQLTGGL
eukprot:1339292-Amphidinium_carterae.1